MTTEADRMLQVGLVRLVEREQTLILLGDACDLRLQRLREFGEALIQPECRRLQF